MIAPDDQQVPARRSVPTRRIVVNSAVAHVHAINDGKIYRSTTLDHPTAHDFPLFVLFEEQLKGNIEHYRRSKFGFLVFSHARVRPLTYREPMRFETMPSSPKPQAWRKMAPPSPG